MEKEIYNVEGIVIEVERPTTVDKDYESRKMGYVFSCYC